MADNVKGGQSEQDDRMHREEAAMEGGEMRRPEATMPETGRKGGETAAPVRPAAAALVGDDGENDREEEGGVAEQANYMGRELHEGKRKAADASGKSGDRS
jgi:hypothetical protein